MAKLLDRPTMPDTYEEDFYAWTQEQAAKLRARSHNDIDWENLAEEIDSVGGQQKQEIENRLDQLLMHLLKARFQPEQWKGGWQATIKVQRLGIQKVIRRNPSLKKYPADVLAEEYETARLLAIAETGLPESTFPETCPFTIEEIMDDGFFG
ncbi:DUF29 domain-containing protein [Chthonobacter albigriseus]|uniref:DUF29 domain-containing protein n=1 Tax=Chthonobacter albigriseus TaxID=1683161 RepID=UPI0019D5326A|nr:DUF29 domain-containing protein [Chthonobacter albigriseus]